jgi:hypothetical protein
MYYETINGLLYKIKKHSYNKTGWYYIITLGKLIKTFFQEDKRRNKEDRNN